MTARGIALLGLLALCGCGDDGEEELTRQECESVAAHLVVLEKLEGQIGGPMCKYHSFCDGADRRLFLKACPKVLSRKQVHCYQRATTLDAADDCLPRVELDGRVQSVSRGDGYGYGGSTFLGTTGGSRPQDRALRDLTALREDACQCRDTACATQVENRFQDLARRLGDLDHAPALRDRAQQIAEEAMKCLVGAMVPPDAGAPVPSTSGMPSCDQYVTIMQAYADCPQFPATSRASVLASIETMKRGWADYATLDPSARQSADDACKQAVDAIRQSAASMGCSL